MVEISASLLSLKNENVIQTLYNLETAKIDYFHIDVMDGEFVENNTANRMTEYCEYLSSISNLPLDVHLMVKDVPSYISSFLVFEPNIITFHLEAAKDKEQVMEWIKLIKQNNVRVGISVKPDTQIEEVAEFLPFVHLVLVMTVEPGKGGQELLPQTIEKIANINKFIYENGYEVDIEVDGGINKTNIKSIVNAGADILVVGSAIIEAKDYKKEIEDLKQ